MPFKLRDYNVLEMLGQGSFGQVYQCLQSQTGQVTAVKVMKSERLEDFYREVCMLHLVRQLNPDKYNIVKFIEHFTWNNDKCLVFEMLDLSLFDLLRKRNYTFPLSEIRVIAQQLLVAFQGLKQLEIVYTDLKLDNVMLVNQRNQPFKVKLIDFGLARPKAELKQGRFVQPCGYTAPEVSLGLPLTEALDMWSLGCVLVHLYMGVHPFCGRSLYNNHRTVTNLLGLPPQKLLSQGLYTKKLYTLRRNGQWRLKTPYEFCCDENIYSITTAGPLEGFYLKEAINSHTPHIQMPEVRDRSAFVSLVKQLLHLDYTKRITPGEALKHAFITMDYLKDNKTEYADWARDLMASTVGSSQSRPQEPATEDVPVEIYGKQNLCISVKDGLINTEKTVVVPDLCQCPEEKGNFVVTENKDDKNVNLEITKPSSIHAVCNQRNSVHVTMESKPFDNQVDSPVKSQENIVKPEIAKETDKNVDTASSFSEPPQIAVHTDHPENLLEEEYKSNNQTEDEITQTTNESVSRREEVFTTNSNRSSVWKRIKKRLSRNFNYNIWRAFSRAISIARNLLMSMTQ